MRLPAKATHAADAPAQPAARPADALRLRPDQPRGRRPQHGPDPDHRQRRRRRPARRGDRGRGRPRAVERRQGADPARASSATRATSSAWTSASARSPAPSSTSAARSGASIELPVDGRDGDDALAIVFRLVDELIAEAARPPLGIGVGTPGLVDTRDRHDPLGRQPRLAGPAARRPAPRAVRPAGQRRQRHPGRGPRRVHVRHATGGACPTSSRSRWGGGSAPGSCSTARSSRATASAPARSATSRWSTTALPAAAAGSAAWRRSRAAAAIAARAAASHGARDAARGAVGDGELASTTSSRPSQPAIRPRGPRSRGRSVPRPGDRGADRRAQRQPDRPRRTVTGVRRRLARDGRRRGTPPLARPAERRHRDRVRPARSRNVVVLGASALLITRELGLSLAR